MKLREIYELAVKMGIKADPRGDEIVRRILDDNNEELNNLSDNEKEFFDEEKLFNPYADSRILYGDDDREIKKLIVGVDMETQELLLTAELNRRGAAIDLVFSHHPEGVALAALAEVMSLQTDCMELLGVRPAMAEALMSGRIKEVGRSVGVNNHSRAVDAARLLDMPFM
ncbi:MAG: NGG1p interacting factor NIF3, partial [Clostridiales bacterium]